MARGVGSFYRGMKEINAVTAESRLEGGFTQNELIKKQYDAFIEQNGREPNDQENEFIYSNAVKASTRTMLANAPGIFVSNRITLDLALNPYGKLSRTFASNSLKSPLFKIVKGVDGKLSVEAKGLKAGFENLKGIRKVFNNEDLQKFFLTVKDIGIATEIINFEKTKDGFTEITGLSIDLAKAQDDQAKIIKSFQEELEKYYLSQIKVGETTFEQIVKNANLTEEQEKKLLEQKTASRDEQIKIIKDIAKTQAEGVANIVTTVTEEESTIRAFLAQLQTLRTENIGDTQELIKQTLLDNVELLIEETQKVNAIVLDENKSARQNLLSFEEQIAKKGIDLTKYTEEEKLKIVQAYLDAQSTSEADRLEESLQNISDSLSAFQNVFSMFEESFTTYLEQQNQKRTTAIEDAYNLQLAALESNLAAGLIARESYDNQLEQLDQAQAQKKLALEREEFKKTKALNIVNATINGAQAVLSTFAGTPGGIVIKGIAAALAGIFAATQIALIARQEFTAADGGIVPGMGSGDIDSVPATLAPGEAVINSKSTEAFLPLLSAINEMGGGRSFVPDLPATNQGQRFAPIFVDNERSREPIRAYVVESDISSAQKRVNRIERSTRF
jgi:hypothetical protein